MLSLNWRRPLLALALRARRPTTARELALLRSLDRASQAELTRVQEERLESLLRHAFHNTAYYREVLGDCGVVRNHRVDLGQLQSVPILTKEIIRTEGERLRDHTLPPARRAYANRTGGSTGQPIHYWQDSHYWDINVATKLYHFEVLGKHPGEPELKIWGSDRDIVIETGTLRRNAENSLYNRRIVPCGTLGEPELRAIVDEVDRFRPKLVWGYIDGLYTVAQYVNRTGREMHKPVAVVIGGGTLLPPMREAIARAFRAPVINFYGSREMGDVACECPATSGMHISINSHLVEVVDARGRPVVGRDGDLVITSLHNYAMPFIRYQMGDRGRLGTSQCPCGRNPPLLEEVSGRSMESFVRRDGAVVSPIFLITTLGNLIDTAVIRRVQLVQESHDLVVVRFVAGEAVGTTALQEHQQHVRAKLVDLMGPTCKVRFDQVDDIPATASGKYLYTVSKVAATGPAEPIQLTA